MIIGLGRCVRTQVIGVDLLSGYTKQGSVYRSRRKDGDDRQSGGVELTIDTLGVLLPV